MTMLHRTQQQGSCGNTPRDRDRTGMHVEEMNEAKIQHHGWLVGIQINRFTTYTLH